MMSPKPEPLVILSLQAREQLHELIVEQQLLEVIQNEMDAPNPNTLVRVQLLLDCYRSRIDNYLSELKRHLTRITELVGSDED